MPVPVPKARCQELNPVSDPIDLLPILEDWPFDPDHDARIIRLADGREVLQVRLPLGLEQYELEGRPDGLRPHEKESVLAHQLERLVEARQRGQGECFRLNAAECAELFQEGTLYYFRYLHLFQLKEWLLTERDTAHNLRLFDFVRRHAARADDQQYLERWRPYLLRMNAIARAMIELGHENYAKAHAVLHAAIRDIEQLPEVDDDTFRYENRRSLAALKDLAAQIDETKPLTEVERLENQLQQAIVVQDFERAARLRDQIRGLRARPQQS